MPISGWIMVAWFLLVIIAGGSMLAWGWRNAGAKERKQTRYVIVESREPEPWRGGEGQDRR